ncbi:hypothetical protein JBL43_00410 [Aureibaculum sp. A20]|uniref:Uncharacterized protein n=1 Tax=Aureibaculum flavum TaxID=2795986 RepID=A0ABS0WL53_9FLAO|nr:hypothetical protein [Aureibaculum flavum]MBJ2172679.1 hypothetical protein [Aureibaculum flavum]
MKFKLFLSIVLITSSLLSQETVVSKIRLLPNENYSIEKIIKINTTIEPTLNKKQLNNAKEKKIDPKVTNKRRTLSKIKLTTNEIDADGKISSKMQFSFNTSSSLVINGETKHKVGPTYSDTKFLKEYNYNLKSKFEPIELPEGQLKIGDTFETISNERLQIEGYRELFFIKRKTSFTVTHINKSRMTLSFIHDFYLDDKSTNESELTIIKSNGKGVAEYNCKKSYLTIFNSKFEVKYSFKSNELGIIIIATIQSDIKQTISTE